MNLITYAIIGIFILLIMAIVSNSGQSSITRIENQLYLINCPAPLYDAVASNTVIEGFAVNYTVAYGAGSQNGTNTFNTIFECAIDSITGNKQVFTIIKEYDPSVWGSFTLQWFDYAGDWLSTQVLKIGNYGILISYIMTPANFDILGFTLNDLNVVGLAIIIGLYIFAYIPIIVFAYKSLMPFTGLG